MFSNKIVNFKCFKKIVYFWKCKEFFKKCGIFKIIHVSKNIQQFICFLKFKTKIVSNLTLEYVLNGSSWPLVGRTHFFEWLIARSRFFKDMVSILQHIGFWIFFRALQTSVVLEPSSMLAHTRTDVRPTCYVAQLASHISPHAVGPKQFASPR